ncbi:MAG: hypothetical protein R3330_12845, partial [Saprospiraceae bacterium]|nr:hypothetical protein [Saprospiraceae bacterium]
GEALFFDGSNTGGSCSNCGNNGAAVMTLVADLFNDQTTLPVQLISFEARRKSGVNVLKWSTARELNSRSFDIERSQDARHFTEIGSVPAAGNAQETRHYEFVDQTTIAQNLYYRLRYTDLDGFSGYSPLRMVPGDAASQHVVLRLFRNPARDGQIDLIIDNDQPGITLSIRLLDGNGRPVQEIELLPDLGRSSACLDANALPPGWYVVAVHTTEGPLSSIPVILQ